MGPIQLILRRSLRKSGFSYPALAAGYIFLADERNKRLLDETQDYLIDRKDNENG